MNHTKKLSLLFMVGLLIFSFHQVHALTVLTNPSDPSIAGEEITLKLKLSSKGVEQGPSFPLGPATGEVGEPIELGDFDTQPKRQVQLLVELPWGSYFNDVSSQEIQSGQIEIDVYPIDDQANVEATQHGVLVQPFPNRVMVREFIVLRNNGEGLAGKGNSVSIDLPDQLNRIIPGPSMGGPSDLQKEGEYYNYQRLLPPGETVLGYFYMIQPDGGKFAFDRTVTLPTQQLVFSIPKSEKLTVSSETLRKTTRSSRKGQGKSLLFRGTNLDVDQNISLKLSNLDSIGGPGAMGSGQEGREKKEPLDRPSSFSTISWPLWIGIGFSLLIFVTSYGYVQYKLSNLPETSVSADFLVQEIARLDQEYEDSAVEEPFYRRTRRRWKNKLEELEDTEST